MAEAAARRDSSYGQVTEVVLRFDGSDRPLFDVAQETGCEFELERLVPCPDGTTIEYLRTSGVDPGRLVRRLGESSDVYDARIVHRGELATRIELNTGGGSLRSLVDHGVLFPRISATPEATTLTAYVPLRLDPGRAMGAFFARHPEAELVAKRRTSLDAPPWSWHRVVSTLLEGLTDRQVQVLRVALENGYFEAPRENTGEEVAEMLGISAATFSSHLRAAEANLLAGLFQRLPATEPGR